MLCYVYVTVESAFNSISPFTATSLEGVHMSSTAVDAMLTSQHGHVVRFDPVHLAVPSTYGIRHNGSFLVRRRVVVYGASR